MTKDAPQDDLEAASLPPKDSSYRHLPWLKLPAPVKAIFDRFPLQIYDRNELPHARIGSRKAHTLYVFTTEYDAQCGAPSFNPTCLKWQAYLRFCGANFVTCPSSNHASTSGALPFLLPMSSQGEEITPISSRNLRAWVEREKPKSHEGSQKQNSSSANGGTGDGKLVDLKYEAYTSLLDSRVRSAYLYTLYICTPNFNAITRPLYVEAVTSSASVRIAQAHQLRKVARSELLKQNPLIDADAIYRECGNAFEALSTLLGDSDFFEGEEGPGLLDAAVFGYTNLLRQSGLQWQETTMRESLEEFQNLISHRERILENFFAMS